MPHPGRRKPRPVDLPDAPFRVADVVAAGVPRYLLRGPRVFAPFYGIRTTTEAKGLAEECEALLTGLAGGVAFSHVTALRLLGVEVPWTMATDRRIHVVTSDEAERPRRADVVAHRSRQSFLDTARIGALPVTTPAQTFVHVATDLRLPDDVVVLGDAMMRRQQGLTRPAELLDVAERTRKVKGIVQVRDLIEQLRPGTDSSTETRTRLVLTEANLPCPQVNEVVLAPDGRYVKRVDMMYRDLKIAIEYDGDQHRTDKAQWREDVRARRWLEAMGWIVIVVVADDLRDGGRDLLAAVRAARARRR